MSERRACRTLRQPRSTRRYTAKGPDADRLLIAEVCRLAEIYPRRGSPRVRGPWKQEHLQAFKRRQSERRIPDRLAYGFSRHRPTDRKHVGSYDFVIDRTEHGRQLKLPVVIDEFTRECLAIEAARSFTSRDVQRWLDRAAVRSLYPQKASPQENRYVESRNGKLRDKLANRELFLRLDEARHVLDEWRSDYNHRRPHSGIDWMTPAAYAATPIDRDGAFPPRPLADPPVGVTPFPAARRRNQPQPSHTDCCQEPGKSNSSQSRVKQ